MGIQIIAQVDHGKQVIRNAASEVSSYLISCSVIYMNTEIIQIVSHSIICWHLAMDICLTKAMISCSQTELLTYLECIPLKGM